MANLKSFTFRIIRILLAIVKPVSIGVRVMLIQDGRILLVRHTYQNGWFLIGGGAKRKESLEKNARREAREEAGAELGELKFTGIYTNLAEGRADHIAVFLCTEFTYTGQHDREIAELRAFPLDALPEDVHRAHRRRIEEYVGGSNDIPQFGLW